MRPLPKLLSQGSAPFLDFDGTLADRPDAVDVIREHDVHWWRQRFLDALDLWSW